jgi:APA family basic amino acid/polyamine antiporter
LLLSVWVVAGGITLCGALSNAEVACMFPETGGQYVFFKKMYGNTFAFIYGWAAFAVFNTGGIASIAYVCSQYTTYFVHLPAFSSDVERSVFFHIPAIGNIYPLENAGVKALTIVLVIVFTVINYLSVRYGGALQTILTALKAAALTLLIAGIFLSGKGSVQNIVTNSPAMPQGMAMFSAYIAAIAGAFWAYDGWNNITFVSGEIINPQKNIPKSLFGGLLTVIIIYALINLAYIYVLPIQQLRASQVVASDAATVAWGTIGGSAIALMVILSTLGTTNGNVLAIARVTYAMHEESKWFNWAGKVQPTYQTPGNALILNGVWTILLIITGSFDMLTDMLIFVTWFFYGMSALGVFILRKKMPQQHRSYKVWGYPFVPLFFVSFTAFFLLFTLYKDIINYQNGTTPIINSLLGTLITCIGIPIYYLSRKKKVIEPA